MKGSAALAARRYARALLDVALAGRIEPQKVRSEIDAVAQAFLASAELQTTLTHPGLGAERRQAVVKALFGGRVSDLVARLLALLAEKGRLALLPAIAEAYARALNEHRGVVAAEATSAVPLEAAQLQALEAALRSATGREVELVARVDPTLLGGVVVSMGGRTFDGSVRTRLSGLRRQLRGAAA